MNKLNNDQIRKNKDEAFMEMMVWMFALGECKQKLEQMREKCEKFINEEDFDEELKDHKLILEIYNELRFLEVNISP